MNQASQSQMNDDDFLHARFDDYLSESLSPSDTERFRTLLKNSKNEEFIDRLKRAWGAFQVTLQGYYLTEDQRVSLHDLVEDSEVRRTREAKRIEELGRWEAVSDFKRRLTLILLVVAIVFSVIYYFTPNKRVEFDPLQSLAYEALAMEEKPEGRLDLPTHDADELNTFISSYKGLDYEPRPLPALPPEWRPDGATVIDYDSARIVAVQYSSSARNEKMFYFNYAGSVNQLPKTNTFEVSGQGFYPYSSDDYNIVCWQLSDKVVGMLIGRRSGRDLAGIAVGSR